jgi:hypothetical protein
MPQYRDLGFLVTDGGDRVRAFGKERQPPEELSRFDNNRLSGTVVWIEQKHVAAPEKIQAFAWLSQMEKAVPAGIDLVDEKRR